MGWWCNTTGSSSSSSSSYNNDDNRRGGSCRRRTIHFFHFLFLVAKVWCLSCVPTIHGVLTCNEWCTSNMEPWTKKCNWDTCGGCNECYGPGVTKFKDVTNSFNRGDNNWDSIGHSFKPSNFNFAPAFPDWNNDGYLDYFYPNHQRENPKKEWDFAISVKAKRSLVGRKLKSIGLETLQKIDDISYNHDSHGVAFADIDNDGNLDLIVAVGGGRGFKKGAKLDNLLYWGTDNDTLRGGRDAANDAGITCSNCRSRSIYVTDANRDGLLDIMSVSNVRVDNELTPGMMQFNNGDRTFSTTNSNMREYSNSIILTDADGDGYAQEYVVFRTSCFRDPSKGDYPSYYKDFCEYHPDKTTAIYKYMGGEMRMISPTYRRFSYQDKFVGYNAEGAVDSATGDFDHDQRADLVVLFQDKLIIYYSSDREKGELPLYNEDEKQRGFVKMNIPCSSKGVAIRVVDLDNNGEPELVLACSDPGEIYVLKIVGFKGSVAIDTDWNLGHVDRKKRWAPTLNDLNAACKDGKVRDGIGSNWDYHCRNFEKHGGPGRTNLNTFSLIDLNNDGFLDVVAAHEIGYQRFFLSIPTEPRNRFIRFELKCTSSNVYGIGTTLIFKASGLRPQFREISTHGHGNSPNGSVDDRIIFGLGQAGMPTKLTVRWPTGKQQIVDLSDIGEWRISNFDQPVIVKEE